MATMTSLSPTARRVYGFTVFGLALTGMAQMPIFKRYYIADLPGLGWLADFYLTNILHYGLATVFLGFMGYAAARYAMEKGLRLTASGWIRAVILTVLIITGLLRVIKNMDGVFLGPLPVLLVDWIHLLAAVVLGMAALGRMASRKS